MRKHFFTGALVAAGIVLSSVAASGAQNSVALSLYGAFNGTTNANGTAQSPSNSAGGLVELRHISNPLIGYEATYSYNRANQRYTACNGITQLCSSDAIKANAHEVTADWILSVHGANLRPFVLGGGGLLLNIPTSGQSDTSTSTKGVFVYGAGIDWTLIPHIGLRFQYRGNLYKAPNLTKLYTSTDRFTQTAEPMIGAYISF